MIKFGEYLRVCRERKGVTQSELVEELVAEDASFSSLDSTTLSRWERGVSKPAISKQTLIIRYFSRSFNRIYPFIGEMESLDIEANFCAMGFSKFVGRHRMVADFPVNQMDIKQLQVQDAVSSGMHMTALRKNYLVIEGLYEFGLDEDLHHRLAMQPGNYFTVCQYQEEYFGHFLALKLNSESFQRVMNFSLEISQLDEQDFVGKDEAGEYFIVGFFSIGDLPISMLWIGFYAHLIREQMKVGKVGGLVTTKEGEAIARNLNTEMLANTRYGDKCMKSYYADIGQMLLTDTIVKMVFNPESCPR
ncbi:helix-turn-helix domain-containing protein [Thiomicrorhabdus xiamenensis]|uniref:Helix-turn-helix domain-containing protein n=1 Tax=Thiomicrorhabdus xiamenensis TaxID=2739063 RepID=A0A7D4TEZ4_9GAMM|nr:helix-turn-helix transcriptional regulator [Thiomicrorhabdus xiamenensis]QKI88408.1 helix-turn-helix domain-containing protein [Thiomicrorhabdus xiamenensis]